MDLSNDMSQDKGCYYKSEVVPFAPFKKRGNIFNHHKILKGFVES